MEQENPVKRGESRLVGAGTEPFVPSFYENPLRRAVEGANASALVVRVPQVRSAELGNEMSAFHSLEATIETQLGKPVVPAIEKQYRVLQADGQPDAAAAV